MKPWETNNPALLLGRAAVKPYRVEVFRSKRGKWQWRIRHKNRRILATSEEYQRRGTALRIARRFAGISLLMYVHEVNR